MCNRFVTHVSLVSTWPPRKNTSSRGVHVSTRVPIGAAHRQQMCNRFVTHVSFVATRSPLANKSSRGVYFRTRVSLGAFGVRPGLRTVCAYTASKCVTDLLHMFLLLRPGPRLQTSQVAGFTSELGFRSGPSGFARGCAQSAHMWYLGAHLNCTLSSLLFTPHPTEPSTQVLESKGFAFGVRVYAHSPQNKPICGTLASVLSAPRLRLLKPKTLPKPKT